MSATDKDRGLDAFDYAIVEDRGPGVEVLETVGQEADADGVLRLTEEQTRALLEYDRAIATTKSGDRIVVEMSPVDDRGKPVEIRESDSEADADHREGSA